MGCYVNRDRQKQLLSRLRSKPAGSLCAVLYFKKYNGSRVFPSQRLWCLKLFNRAYRLAILLPFNREGILTLRYIVLRGFGLTLGSKIHPDDYVVCWGKKSDVSNGVYHNDDVFRLLYHSLAMNQGRSPELVFAINAILPFAQASSGGDHFPEINNSDRESCYLAGKNKKNSPVKAVVDRHSYFLPRI